MSQLIIDPLSLAPDSASIKAAQGLVKTTKWHGLSELLKENGELLALWGECSGSGSSKYKTQAYLHNQLTPTFKCTCPSRKFPCKHSLALLLVYKNNNQFNKTNDLPDWVDSYIKAQEQKLINKVEKLEKKQDNSENKETSAKKVKSADINTEKYKKIDAGINELNTFLNDVISRGIAQININERENWIRLSKRLIDSSLPILSKQIEDAANIIQTSNTWTEKLLIILARIQLAICAISSRDKLNETEKNNLKALVIGQPEKKEFIKQTCPHIADDWVIIASAIEYFEKLNTSRVWLYGLNTGKIALIQESEYKSTKLSDDFDKLTIRQAMPISAIGTTLKGKVAFYPLTQELRAIFVEIEKQEKIPENIEKLIDIKINYTNNTNHQISNWYKTKPVIINPAFIDYDSKQEIFTLTTDDNKTLKLSGNEYTLWQLLAMANNCHCWIMGEWEDSYLEEYTLKILSAYTKYGFWQSKNTNTLPYPYWAAQNETTIKYKPAFWLNTDLNLYPDILKSALLGTDKIKFQAQTNNETENIILEKLTNQNDKENSATNLLKTVAILDYYNNLNSFNYYSVETKSSNNSEIKANYSFDNIINTKQQQNLEKLLSYFQKSEYSQERRYSIYILLAKAIEKILKNNQQIPPDMAITLLILATGKANSITNEFYNTAFILREAILNADIQSNSFNKLIKYIASKNPKWQWALNNNLQDNNEDWTMLSIAQMLHFIKNERIKNPENANNLLIPQINKIPAQNRSEFLYVLNINLNNNDIEALCKITTYNNIRSHAVKVTARSMLSLLPAENNEFTNTMSKYLAKYFSLDYSNNVFKIILPEVFEDDFKKFNLEKDFSYSNNNNDIASREIYRTISLKIDKNASVDNINEYYLLFQIIKYTPFSFWDNYLKNESQKITIEELITLVLNTSSKDDNASAFILAWISKIIDYCHAIKHLKIKDMKKMPDFANMQKWAKAFLLILEDKKLNTQLSNIYYDNEYIYTISILLDEADIAIFLQDKITELKNKLTELYKSGPSELLLSYYRDKYLSKPITLINEIIDFRGLKVSDNAAQMLIDILEILSKSIIFADKIHIDEGYIIDYLRLLDFYYLLTKSNANYITTAKELIPENIQQIINTDIDIYNAVAELMSN